MFTHAFLASPQVGTVVQISGPEAKHAVQVRRMRIGEAIQLTDTAGLRVRGEVSATDKNSLTVVVTSVENEPAAQLQLTLVQALAKGDRDELAIQAATELGITSIVPWESDRSISRWIGIKEIKGVERWQSIVTEAAKQSLRVWHPKVESPIQGAQVTELTQSHDLVLVLEPTSHIGLAEIEIPKNGRIALIVGPEGGISGDELGALEAAGVTQVNIGASILRTSTAGVAAISAILALSGSWGSK